MVSYDELMAWQPGKLTSIAEKLNSDRKRLSDVHQDLHDGRPPGTWTGKAARAGLESHKQVSDALESLREPIPQVIRGLDTAAGAIKRAQDKARTAKEHAESRGWHVSFAGGGVSVEAKDDPDADQASVRECAQDISDALTDGAQADADLTSVLTSATRSVAGPSSKSGSVDGGFTKHDASILGLFAKTVGLKGWAVFKGVKDLKNMAAFYKKGFGRDIFEASKMWRAWEEQVKPAEGLLTKIKLGGTNLGEFMKTGTIKGIPVGKIAKYGGKAFAVFGAATSTVSAFNNFKKGDNLNGTLDLVQAGLSAGMLAPPPADVICGIGAGGLMLGRFTAEHWDDISHAASDAGRAIGHAAEKVGDVTADAVHDVADAAEDTVSDVADGAKDVASKAWHSIF